MPRAGDIDIDSDKDNASLPRRATNNASPLASSPDKNTSCSAPSRCYAREPKCLMLRPCAGHLNAARDRPRIIPIPQHRVHIETSYAQCSVGPCRPLIQARNVTSLNRGRRDLHPNERGRESSSASLAEVIGCLRPPVSA